MPSQSKSRHAPKSDKVNHQEAHRQPFLKARKIDGPQWSGCSRCLGQESEARQHRDLHKEHADSPDDLRHPKFNCQISRLDEVKNHWVGIQSKLYSIRPFKLRLRQLTRPKPFSCFILATKCFSHWVASCIS